MAQPKAEDAWSDAEREQLIRFLEWVIRSADGEIGEDEDAERPTVH